MVAESDNGEGNGTPPKPADPPLPGQSFTTPGQVVEPYDTYESTPPPGSPPSPAAPQAPVSPQHLIEEETAAPAEQQVPAEQPELNFFDNAMISVSLAPDWAKFLAAAAVTAVLALIGIGLINDDSSSDDVPDGFVPQTPELEDGALPESPETPAPTGAESDATR